MHCILSAPSQERERMNYIRISKVRFPGMDLNLPFQNVTQRNLGLSVDVQVNKIGKPSPAARAKSGKFWFAKLVLVQIIFQLVY